MTDHGRYHRHGPSSDPYDVEQRQLRTHDHPDDRVFLLVDHLADDHGATYSPGAALDSEHDRLHGWTEAHLKGNAS